MRRKSNYLGFSRSEFQKFKRNLDEPENKKKIPANKPGKKRKNGYDSPIFIYITFFISDNRLRDLDGMVSTIFDCLVRAGMIKDDNRFNVGSFLADYEICPKGQEGFMVRIVKK